MKRLALILAMLVGLSGCTTSTSRFGNANLAFMTNNEVSQRIVRGQTTVQEVLEWIGPPTTQSISMTDNLELWIYTYAESAARGNIFNVKTAANSKTLTITFGQDGTVSRYTFSSNASGLAY